MRAPPLCPVSRSASVSGVGRPAYVRERWSSRVRNAVSSRAAAYDFSSSVTAAGPPQASVRPSHFSRPDRRPKQASRCFRARTTLVFTMVHSASDSLAPVGVPRTCRVGWSRTRWSLHKTDDTLGAGPGSPDPLPQPPRNVQWPHHRRSDTETPEPPFLDVCSSSQSAPQGCIRNPVAPPAPPAQQSRLTPGPAGLARTCGGGQRLNSGALA